MRTVGSVHIVTADWDMYCADGTVSEVRGICNGLKPVVGKRVEPTALLKYTQLIKEK